MNPPCRECGKPLKPTFEYVSVRHDQVDALGNAGFITIAEKTGRIRGYGYAALGHFCSLRCGWAFAVKAVERGRLP